MEQFSELERRIKTALDRIALRIESAAPNGDDLTGINKNLEDKIAELTAANKDLQIQLEKASADDVTIENSKLKAKLAQLELARQAETREMQRLYDRLATALNNNNSEIQEDA